MIREMHGNLLHAEADALVNTVNTVGVMGKGIALQFKRAYPDNFRDYVSACRRGEVRTRKVFVHETGQVRPPYYIINFPTKTHWRGVAKLEDVEFGLSDLRRVIQELNIKSIVLPPLGCGNGGLEWSEVRERIEAALGNLEDVDVAVFPPEGVPSAEAMPVRTRRPRMTVARAALLLAFDRYIQLSDQAALSMDGKFSIIEAQKVVYFLQEAGWSSKHEFVPSYYGPYSQTVDQLISSLEGHFIYGYGDGATGSKAVLQLDERALNDAHALMNSDVQFFAVLDRFVELVEGFEFPYGIELLSTVHYVANRTEEKPATVEKVVASIASWSARKRRLFRPTQAAAALGHLIERHAVAT